MNPTYIEITYGLYKPLSYDYLKGNMLYAAK